MGSHGRIHQSQRYLWEGVSLLERRHMFVFFILFLSLAGRDSQQAKHECPGGMVFV